MRIKSLRNTVSGLIAITVFSQLIAFIRESIFAYYYGTSMFSDAYVMASQIPVTLFAVVSTSISTVILPIYTMKIEKEGEETAQIFLKSAIIMFTIICAVFVIICEAFPIPIVKIFAPSFSGEVLATTIQYVRILFPTIIATVLTNIITVYYNAGNNFFYPTVVAITHNVTAIAAMVFFARQIGVDAIVWGTFIGIVANALFLIIPHIEILRGKIEIQSTWNDVKHVLSRVIPVTIGVGIAEINRIIDRAVASGLDTGSITALNYANKLTVVFSALILSAVTTVSFKAFSELYAKGEYKKRNDTLVNYLTLLMMILVPLTIGAVLLKTQLITVAFGRGAFDTSSITRTSDIFFYSVLGLVFIAVREILSKYFYSSGNTRTPMINAAIGVGINIVLNLLLSRFMGASGLALATTISNVTVCILLFISIIRREQHFPLRDFSLNSIKVGLSSICMLFALLIIRWLISGINAWVEIAIYLVIGVVVYFVTFVLIDRKTLKSTVGLLFERFSSS